MNKVRSSSVFSGVLLSALFSILLLIFMVVSCSVQPNQTPESGGGTSSQAPDTNLPTVTITFPTNNHPTNGANINIEGTASAPGTNCIVLVEISIDGTTFYPVNGTNSWNTNMILTEGTNGLTARAISGNDQTNTSSVVIVRLDTVNPAVNITSVSNYEEVGAAYELGGNITESGSGVSHVFIKIDNGSWKEIDFNPASPYPWTTNISLGSVYGFYTNYVYSTDHAGNVGSTNSMIVNRAAIPSVIIDTPASYLETNSASVTISGDSTVDGASITNVFLSTNGGAYVSVATASNYSVVWSGFPEGTNSIVAKVLSDNGKSNISSTRYFIVDLTPPAAPSVTSTASDYTTDTTPTWIWQSGGNGGSGDYRYKLDNSDLTSGATLITGTNYTPGSPLSSGSHTLYVQERDIAGNWSTSGSKTIEIFSGSAVYVATSGNDTNSGTSTAPFLSIQKAISKAVQYGLSDVNIAIGTYIRNSGLNSLSNGVVITNNNINLRGGFNSGTWTRSSGDYSTIDMEVTTSQRGIRVSNANNVTIDGFLICNGNVSYTLGYGGGIDIEISTNILITNSIISNNIAKEGGAGIYTFFTSNCVINAIVLNNLSSNYGGGIMLNRGYNGKVEGLVSNNTAFGSGGGICIQCWPDETNKNTVTAIVANNYAGSYGGGLYVNGYFNTISGNVHDNTAGRSGGGIYLYLYGCNTTVDSGAVYNNTAVSNNGGGIYMSVLYNNKSTFNTVISNNTALSNGGGIYSISNSLADISGTIIGNSAYYGGGVFTTSVLGTNNAEVCYNSAYSGGGYYITTNFGTNIFGVVHHNTATCDGGGIWITNAHSGIIPATVCWNTASNGGGIYLGVTYFPAAEITGDVCSNTATNGGGIYISTGGRLTVSGNVFKNTAMNGGGIYCDTAFRNTFSGIIHNNYAFKNGGGVYILYGTNNQITGSVISNSVSNSVAYGSRGSGVCIDNSSNTTISGLLSYNITTNAPGGGLYAQYSSNTLFSGVASNNYARKGGGMVLLYCIGFSFTGTVDNNTTRNEDGGGINLDGCTNIYISGTIINNSAVSTVSANGGGLSSYMVNTMYISNQTYISNNSSYSGGAGMLLSSSINVTVCGRMVSNQVTGSGLSSIRGGGVYTYSCTNIDFRYFTNFGNSAYIGGGIYMYNGLSNSFQSSVRIVSCRATNSPGLILENERTFRLNAASITNNYITGTGTNAAICLYQSGTTMTNFYINGAYLGVGNNTGTAYGIFEDDSSDIWNHTLTGIDFYTNNMTYLYHNYNGTNIAITSVSSLNSFNLMNHGATNCSGNTAVAN